MIKSSDESSSLPVFTTLYMIIWLKVEHFISFFFSVHCSAQTLWSISRKKTHSLSSEFIKLAWYGSIYPVNWISKSGWGGWMDEMDGWICLPSLVREDLLQVKISLDLIIREGKAAGSWVVRCTQSSEQSHHSSARSQLRCFFVGCLLGELFQTS